MAANTSRPLTGVTPNIHNKMYDYMDNMDNVVKNKKSVLEQLVETNIKQSSTIVTQATIILVISDEVNKIQQIIINKRGRVSRGGKSDDDGKSLKTAISSRTATIYRT